MVLINHSLDLFARLILDLRDFSVTQHTRYLRLFQIASTCIGTKTLGTEMGSVCQMWTHHRFRDVDSRPRYSFCSSFAMATTFWASSSGTIS